jgi:small-conductance mechanosensitive channel
MALPDPVVTKPDPTDAVREAMTLAITNLRSIVMQRFDGNDKAVELARAEVKSAAAELAKANSEALAAALKTTTEAATKLAESFDSTNKATNEKIDRLTERINVWTGQDVRAVENKQQHSVDRGQTISMGQAAIAIAAAILSAVLYLATKR